MEKVKGMYTCKVCGRDFSLLYEEQYVAADPVPKGAIASLVSMDKANQYDAFDCPHCGCQNIVQTRKPEYCPCDYGICDECCCEEAEEEEEGDDTEKELTLEEMIEALRVYCRSHPCCNECSLHVPQFKCGRGVWFDKGMTPEEVAEAYKVAMEDK